MCPAPARRPVQVASSTFASTEGLGATPYLSPYTASKHGVVGLTKSLAAELGARGITVNCVCPGPINTGMTAPIPDDAKQKFARRRVPLRRYGEPREVAQMVCNLVLPAVVVRERRDRPGRRRPFREVRMSSQAQIRRPGWSNGAGRVARAGGRSRLRNEDLWDTYAGAHLVRGTVCADSTCAGLEVDALPADPLFVLTAWNPGGVDRDRAANDAVRARARGRADR